MNLGEQDLVQCLEKMLNDPCIEIARIKCRLDPAYSVRDTMGYRDVNVKFRIIKCPIANQDEVSWTLAYLEGHVCEVCVCGALICCSMAALKCLCDEG